MLAFGAGNGLAHLSNSAEYSEPLLLQGSVLQHGGAAAAVEHPLDLPPLPLPIALLAFGRLLRAEKG